MSDDSYKFEYGVVPTLVVQNQESYLESAGNPYRARYGTQFHRRSISEWSTEAVYGGRSTVDQGTMTDFGLPYYKTLCYNTPKVHRSYSGSSNAVLSNDSYPMDLNHIPTFIVQRQTGDFNRFKVIPNIVYDRVYDHSLPPLRTNSKLARESDPNVEQYHHYSYVTNDRHHCGKESTASEVSCPQTNAPRSDKSSSTVGSRELPQQHTNRIYLFCVTECRRFFCLLLIFLPVFLIVVLVINFLNEKTAFGTSVVAVTILLWSLALLCTVITSHLLTNVKHTEEDIT